MPEYYEIKIKGRMDQSWSDWFAGLKLDYLEGDETLISVSRGNPSIDHPDQK